MRTKKNNKIIPYPYKEHICNLSNIEKRPVSLIGFAYKRCAICGAVYFRIFADDFILENGIEIFLVTYISEKRWHYQANLNVHFGEDVKREIMDGVL